MNSKNISKKNSVFSKLGFGWVQTIAVLVVMGMMLSCSNDPTASPTTALGVPQDIIVEAVTPTTATLKWAEVTGANSYIIYRNGDAIATNTGSPPATTYTVAGLTASTDYTFSVKACNDAGCSASAVVPGKTGIPTIPDTPEGLTHTKVTTTAVELGWTPTPQATFYRVFYTNITAGGPEVSNQFDASDFTTNNLTASTEYRFEVEACNSLGCSSRSDLTLTTAPAAPTGLTHEGVTSTSVTLKWDAVTGAKSYVIYQGSDAVFTNTGDSPATTYTATGLTAGSEHTFSVTVCTDDDSALCSVKSDEYQVTTIPPVPTGLTHSDITSASVVLSWDQVPGASKYVVYDGEKPIATNTATPYTVDNLTHSTGYTLTLRACNAFGCSDASTSVTFTTLDAPELFTIRYPKMASEVSATSIPAIASGKNCDLRALTDAGDATYSIAANTAGKTAPTLPTIDERTGVVKNNGTASPGTYKVTVAVTGNAGCSTNVLIYNTVTVDKYSIQIHIFFSDNNGVALFGDTGDYNYIDISEMTDLRGVFTRKSTFNGDVSEWDTSKVTLMSWIFSGASEFNQDISGWDTSQVQSMENMFSGASKFNQPLSNWNTSKVTDMTEMFSGATQFDQDLSKWDVGMATYSDSIFTNSAMYNKKEYYPELWK